jgi:hypothetical protein
VDADTELVVDLLDNGALHTIVCKVFRVKTRQIRPVAYLHSCLSLLVYAYNAGNRTQDSGCTTTSNLPASGSWLVEFTEVIHVILENMNVSCIAMK